VSYRRKKIRDDAFAVFGLPSLTAESFMSPRTEALANTSMSSSSVGSSMSSSASESSPRRALSISVSEPISYGSTLAPPSTQLAAPVAVLTPPTTPTIKALPAPVASLAVPKPSPVEQLPPPPAVPAPLPPVSTLPPPVAIDTSSSDPVSTVSADTLPSTAVVRKPSGELVDSEPSSPTQHSFVRPVWNPVTRERRVNTDTFLSDQRWYVEMLLVVVVVVVGHASRCHTVTLIHCVCIGVMRLTISSSKKIDIDDMPPPPPPIDDVASDPPPKYAPPPLF
jgi:hypothetical protein